MDKPIDEPTEDELALADQEFVKSLESKKDEYTSFIHQATGNFVLSIIAIIAVVVAIIIGIVFLWKAKKARDYNRFLTNLGHMTV